MTKARLLIFAALAVAALVIRVAWDYFDRGSIPHESIRLHLQLTASSIYEFHQTAGRWPANIDDLASTSLPLKSPYWRSLIENGSVAVVWRSDLKPDPKDNAALVMTYNNTGLFSKLGRVWICWGDLRTEFVKDEELHAKLSDAAARR